MTDRTPYPHAYPGYPQAGAALPPGWQGMAPPAAPGTAAAGGNRFLRGLLIGGAVAYLLSNEQLQQSAIRGAVRTWSAMQGSVEEMKERFRDAEAELHATQAHD